MKNIRTAIFLFLFLFALGVFVTQSPSGQGSGQGYGQGSGQGRGQGQGCQMPGAGDHLKALSERLNLSQDQQASIEVILEDQLAQLRAIRTDASLSPSDKMSKIRSLREASASQVRGQLNDGQKKRFDEMRQDAHERMKERQARGEDCSLIWMPMD